MTQITQQILPRINFIERDKFNQLSSTDQRVFLNSYIHLWVVAGSNKSANLDELVVDLQTIIDNYIFDTNYYSIIEYQIKKIFFNRDRDLAFLNKIFTINNENIALACVKIISELFESQDISNIINIDINFYFDSFENRFGSNNREYISVKLNYYSLSKSNFTDNVQLLNDLYLKLNTSLDK